MQTPRKPAPPEPIILPEWAGSVSPVHINALTGGHVYVFGTTDEGLVIKHYTPQVPRPGAKALCGRLAGADSYKNLNHDRTCDICGNSLPNVKG